MILFTRRNDGEVRHIQVSSVREYLGVVSANGVRERDTMHTICLEDYARIVLSSDNGEMLCLIKGA